MTKFHLNFSQSVTSAKVESILEEQFISKYSDKGVSTFFYIAIRNHVELGNVADKKSNILLSINALIFSILVSKLIIQLNHIEVSKYFLPIAIILVTNISTMIFCVLTTRPKISSGEFTEEAITDRNVNLAFFGNFYKMDFKDYDSAVRLMIKNKPFIHSVLTKDLYFLGQVLHKKYVLLNYTYLIFSIGICVAILVVIGTALFN